MPSFWPRARTPQDQAVLAVLAVLAAAPLRAAPGGSGRSPLRGEPCGALRARPGSGVAGRNRLVRYCAALGSAREVRSCIDVALALNYLPSFPHDAAGCLDKVTATLVLVSR